MAERSDAQIRRDADSVADSIAATSASVEELQRALARLKASRAQTELERL
jgi:hypothetical protein